MNGDVLGMFLMMFWGCFGDVLGMFWGCTGDVLVMFCARPPAPCTRVPASVLCVLLELFPPEFVSGRTAAGGSRKVVGDGRLSSTPKIGQNVVNILRCGEDPTSSILVQKKCI